MSHEGSVSIWHLLLTFQEAEHFEDVVRSFGASVKRYSEKQTEEQTEEREQLLAAQRGDLVFRCAECPSCFWLDMNVPRYCGFDGWEDETCNEALHNHEKALLDLAACPVWDTGGGESPAEG